MKINFLKSILRPSEFSEIGLPEYLDMVRAGKFESFIKEYRAAKARQEPKDIQTTFKNKIPAVTISGIFKGRVANANLIEHSGFLCIDFDHVENVEKLKKQLCNDKHTYCVLYSVSGDGLAVVVKIDPSRHLDSYNGLKNYYFQKYGQLIDKACSNVSRFRFVSMDKDLYINPRSTVFKEFLKKEVQPKAHNVVLTKNEFGDLIGKIVDKKIDITDDYKNWLTVAFALQNEFGESGRDYFHIVSQQNTKYDQSHCDKQYSYCLRDTGNKKIRIGSFYYLCKQAGIELKSITGRKLEQIAKMAKKSGRTSESVVAIAKSIGIDEKSAIEMADAVFSQNVDLSITAGSDVEVIQTFLNSNYKLRFNVITQEIEDHNVRLDGRYQVVTDMELNTMYMRFVDECGEKLASNFFIQYIFSKYTPFYNPFLQFFEENKDIERSPDLIDQLSSTIDTTTPHVDKWIKHWGCGMIAGIYGTASPLVLVLAGEKLNKGKTEWFRRLLPFELKLYYAESNLDDGKDADILMCRKLMIMDDEFSGKSKMEAKRFKKLTSKQSFSIRPPYGRTSIDMNRIAVLCGTTNDLSILNDPMGNRRIIPIKVDDVDKKLYNSIDKRALFMAFHDLYHSGFQWQLNTEDIALLNEDDVIFQATNYERELIEAHFYIPTDTNQGGEWWSNTEIKTWIELISKQRVYSQNKLGQELINLGFLVKISNGKKYLIKKKSFDPPSPQSPIPF